MVSIERALSEFIDDWNAGRRPQVDDYLERVDEPDRDELAGQISAWLTIAPAPGYDDRARAARPAEPAFAATVAAMAAEAGLWPVVLPRARERASLSVRELAAKLAAAVGLGRDAEPKTESYLEQLERGELDATRLSRRVIDALADLLRLDPQSLAGGGPVRAAPMFRAP